MSETGRQTVPINKPGKPPVKERSSNFWFIELHKFVGKDVTVLDSRGVEHQGVFCAFSSQHLNVIIRTDDEKIIIRNVVTIRRKRSAPAPAVEG